MGRTGSISETLYRHWQILRHVPRAPRKMDTASLERLLREDGIEVHRRSLQRDLESLAGTFTTLRCDEQSKPYGWSWDRDAPMLEVPPMNVATAVTLELVRSHLAQTLPRVTLKTLDPYFRRARELLESSGGTRLARWPEKVRVLPRGVSLRAPDVSADVLDVVYRSLLEGRLIHAWYRTRGATHDKDYDVNPLGLVVRNGTLVLVCTLREYEDVNQLLLHRMKRAELLESPVRRPAGFDLDEHIEEGGVAFRRGARIRLRARIARQVAITLGETPIARDQKLTPRGEEHVLLEATVADTVELRGWLAGYGPLVEVLAPEGLREEFRVAARKLAEMYQRTETKAAVAHP